MESHKLVIPEIMQEITEKEAAELEEAANRKRSKRQTSAEIIEDDDI